MGKVCVHAEAMFGFPVEHCGLSMFTELSGNVDCSYSGCHQLVKPPLPSLQQLELLISPIDSYEEVNI